MEKQWNFDQIIDRKDTGSIKWSPEVLKAKFGRGREGLLPFWVADMDFYCPPVVHRAMARRLDHQIYGYSLPDKDYHASVVSWFRRRHNWDIRGEWLMSTPGVVPAVNYMIQRFTCPGDKVIIQTPVYYPFATAIETNGRVVAENPLKIQGQTYGMNMEQLAETAADPRVKMAILCSPHNPVGRVWTREELMAFGRICMENNVLVLADEIHCDLIMPGYSHIPYQSLGERFSSSSIALTAASKTFNLAGLSQSCLVIPDPGLRNEMGLYFETLGLDERGGGTLFGAIAARAAYEGGEPWLEDLIQYLHGNYQYLKTELEKGIAGVRVTELEGTYLPWIDFRALDLPQDRLVEICEMKAGIAMDPGDWFGSNGQGFMRINIACPRVILEKATGSLIKAFNDSAGDDPGTFPRAGRGGQCCS